MKTIDAARNRWVSILSTLGIDQNYLRDKHGPCPICGGKDRFRFDNKNGNGTYYCNSCGAGNGINLLMLMNNWDFQTAAERVDEIIGNCPEDKREFVPKKDPRERLQKVQAQLTKVNDVGPVARYLRNRGVPVSDKLKEHPGMAYYEDGSYAGSYPAMVATFSAPSGQPLTFHITYITKAGAKAEVSVPKKILPPVSDMHGGSIKLFPAAEVMGIAEGIETALACYQKFGVCTWAAYSANFLEQFVPPKECENLIIFGDCDASFTGQSAAYKLAARLKSKKQFQHINVDVQIPELIGTDWADNQEKAAS